MSKKTNLHDILSTADSNELDVLKLNGSDLDSLALEYIPESIQFLTNPEQTNNLVDYFLYLFLHNDKRFSKTIASLTIEILLLRNEIEKASSIKKSIFPNEDYPFPFFQANYTFYTEASSVTLNEFLLLYDSMFKMKGKKKLVLPDHISVNYCLSLLLSRAPENISTALAYAEKLKKSKMEFFSGTFETIVYLLQYYSMGSFPPKVKYYSAMFKYPYYTIVYLLFQYLWRKNTRDFPPIDIKEVLDRVQKLHFKWMEFQIRDLHNLVTEKQDATLEDMRSLGIRPRLSSLYRESEVWDSALARIERAFGKKEETVVTPLTEKAYSRKRIGWYVSYRKFDNRISNIVPMTQICQEDGKGESWKKDSLIPLKTLKESPETIPYISQEDYNIIKKIKLDSGSFGNQKYILPTHTILDLVEHTNVYRVETGEKIHIRQEKPIVRIEELAQERIRLYLFPAEYDSSFKFHLHIESPQEWVIYLSNEKTATLLEILGEKGITIPQEGKKRLLESISYLSDSFQIQSSLPGAIPDLPNREPSYTTYLALEFNGEFLDARLQMRPFADEGPFFPPGEGGRVIFLEYQGRKMGTNRDFEKEEQIANHLIAKVAEFGLLNQTSRWHWTSYDLASCYEFFLAIQELEEREDLKIVWKTDVKIAKISKVKTENFHFKIKSSNNWFELEGEAEVSDETLRLEEILTTYDIGEKGYHLTKNNEVVVFEKALRDKLRDLSEWKNYENPKKLQIPPLMADSLNSIVSEGKQLQADREWKNRIKKIQSLKTYRPQVPTTLQATLRDYQIQGFEWMSKLAELGAGACLADDMGLGKTIQTLAMILTKAVSGPSLVVAPSSVCLNWEKEIHRFAPTLHTIHYYGKDRENLIRDLQPFDVVITSYGIVQTEGLDLRLKKKDWEMIVLDEAQAIKNFSSKRTQAVMQLQGKFKLVTTGTPIENHLGELWTLFHFINPGLLGNSNSFYFRFLYPIQEAKSQEKKQALKKIIQPFILRRLKTQVLDELPEKTEITMEIELSKEEEAFYNALRKNALSNIAAKKVATDGQKRIQVLAEIMKLRRACCHPKLIDPKSKIDCSKLNAFREIMKELQENNHKVLIFSQFIDHLSILREALEVEKIPYQYLDGSTPTKERQKRVNAFQAGQGDAFLISLKAGGTGLNLTAADYVIHMDPWWNPAVEDQASDRAHRIGQTRPVTVYRLLTKSTIEEKIISLHKDKRDLADSLLEGSDVSGKITTDDLLNLLKEV